MNYPLDRKSLAELQKAQEMEAYKKYLLKHLVEPKAYERLMNVMRSSPELYDNVIRLLIQLRETGKIRGRVSDADVVKLLSSMIRRRETKITFKRK